MNMRRSFLLSLLTLAVSSAIAHPKGNDRMITLQALEEMFGNMRAKTKWNIDGDLLWGYFFFDRHQGKLRLLGQELQKSGYRLVNLYPSDDRSTYVLHVEKIEHHTPQTLHARNQEFYRLAEQNGIDSYDGMDVGPILQPAKQ
jgi:hypothetical protein